MSNEVGTYRVKALNYCVLRSAGIRDGCVIYVFIGIDFVCSLYRKVNWLTSCLYFVTSHYMVDILLYKILYHKILKHCAITCVGNFLTIADISKVKGNYLNSTRKNKAFNFVCNWWKIFPRSFGSSCTSSGFYLRNHLNAVLY